MHTGLALRLFPSVSLAGVGSVAVVRKVEQPACAVGGCEAQDQVILGRLGTVPYT